MKYTVREGCRYAARIQLTGFEVLASNEQVADKFKQAGFVGVDVTGSGRERIAHGTWPNSDQTAELPSEIIEVIRIPLPPGGGKATTDGTGGGAG